METDIWKNRGKLYASWRPNNQVMSKEGTVNLTILRRRSLSLNIEQLPLNTCLLIISSKLIKRFYFDTDEFKVSFP